MSRPRSRHRRRERPGNLAVLDARGVRRAQRPGHRPARRTRARRGPAGPRRGLPVPRRHRHHGERARRARADDQAGDGRARATPRDPRVRRPRARPGRPARQAGAARPSAAARCSPSPRGWCPRSSELVADVDRRRRGPRPARRPRGDPSQRGSLRRASSTQSASTGAPSRSPSTGDRRRGDDPAVLAPAAHPDRLAGEDDAGEPRREAADRGGVAAEQRVGELAQHDAVGAQPVQDRRREAGRLGEVGVGVQRVAVAAEPVEQRLLRRHVVRRVGVGRAVGQLDRLATRRGRRPSRPRP